MYELLLFYIFKTKIDTLQCVFNQMSFRIFHPPPRSIAPIIKSGYSTFGTAPVDPCPPRLSKSSVLPPTLHMGALALLLFGKMVSDNV